MSMLEELSLLALIAVSAYLLLHGSYYATEKRRFRLAVGMAAIGWMLAVVIALKLILLVYEAR